MPPFRDFNAEARGKSGALRLAIRADEGWGSSSRSILRDALLAVVIEVGMAPCVAAAIGFKGPCRPLRIVILLLKLGQSDDDSDPDHWRILRKNRPIFTI